MAAATATAATQCCNASKASVTARPKTAPTSVQCVTRTRTVESVSGVRIISVSMIMTNCSRVGVILMTRVSRCVLGVVRIQIVLRSVWGPCVVMANVIMRVMRNFHRNAGNLMPNDF